ncbi:peptidoglycan/LPS O-acetylase OafA/YrhL [Sinorhizobium fredii]
MGTIRTIQYLRAAAALAVVVFHAAEKTGHDFAVGAAGVDVFFVISGFIMWVISDRRPLTPAKFIWDRIRRIVPIYWFATAVMIAGALAGLFPNLALTLDHVLASLFFIPFRSPSSGEIWPLLVQGWTLNFEMLFYAVFAASLLLPRHWRLPAIAGLFVALVTIGWVAPLEDALSLTLYPADHPRIRGRYDPRRALAERQNSRGGGRFFADRLFAWRLRPDRIPSSPL